MSGKQYMGQVKTPEVEQPANKHNINEVKGYITLVFSYTDENVYPTRNNFVSSIMSAAVQYNNNKPYTGATRYILEKVINTDYLPDIVNDKKLENK